MAQTRSLSDGVTCGARLRSWCRSHLLHDGGEAQPDAIQRYPDMLDAYNDAAGKTDRRCSASAA